MSHPRTTCILGVVGACPNVGAEPTGNATADAPTGGSEATTTDLTTGTTLVPTTTITTGDTTTAGHTTTDPACNVAFAGQVSGLADFGTGPLDGPEYEGFFAELSP